VDSSPADAPLDGLPSWTTRPDPDAPLRPAPGCPLLYPRRRLGLAATVHWATSVVHPGRPHGHEAPSTASTPWWWWWRS